MPVFYDSAGKRVPVSNQFMLILASDEDGKPCIVRQEKRADFADKQTERGAGQADCAGVAFDLVCMQEL